MLTVQCKESHECQRAQCLRRKKAARISGVHNGALRRHVNHTKHRGPKDSRTDLSSGDLTEGLRWTGGGDERLRQRGEKSPGLECPALSVMILAVRGTPGSTGIECRRLRTRLTAKIPKQNHPCVPKDNWRAAHRFSKGVQWTGFSLRPCLPAWADIYWAFSGKLTPKEKTHRPLPILSMRIDRKGAAKARINHRPLRGLQGGKQMKRMLSTVTIGWVAALAICVLVGWTALGPEGAQGSESAESIIVGLGDHEMQVAMDGPGGLLVRLPSTPSTGYRWEIAEMEQAVLRLVADQWIPDSELLGSSGFQELRFAGVRPGRTPLRLVYRRPWETRSPPLRSFRLGVQVTVPSSPPFINDSTAQEKGTLDETLDQKLDGAKFGFPKSFNWCDLHGCPPVRDQGNCGSCWAFATVAPFESVLKWQQNLARDFSEQYLISCNMDGWGCGGGWWAHDYHIDKKPAREATAGAVLESECPYTAEDTPCGDPHHHEETLAAWAFVGRDAGVPPVAQIKEALMNFGPIAAAVCVNRAFQNYRNGVFSSSDPCPKVNHAVVLVGWDDREGVWILRNSWGSGWGEGGYMRIRYGQNQVGYGANFVVY